MNKLLSLLVISIFFLSLIPIGISVNVGPGLEFEVGAHRTVSGYAPYIDNNDVVNVLDLSSIWAHRT